MLGEAKPTAEVNGVLWGARSADWASLQEIQCRPVYEALLERLSVGPGTVLLDAGCGAGLVSQWLHPAGRVSRVWTLLKPCWPLLVGECRREHSDAAILRHYPLPTPRSTQ
jgi:hypothetical protein